MIGREMKPRRLGARRRGGTARRACRVGGPPGGPQSRPGRAPPWRARPGPPAQEAGRRPRRSRATAAGPSGPGRRLPSRRAHAGKSRHVVPSDFPVRVGWQGKPPRRFPGTPRGRAGRPSGDGDLRLSESPTPGRRTERFVVETGAPASLPGAAASPSLYGRGCGRKGGGRVAGGDSGTGYTPPRPGRAGHGRGLPPPTIGRCDGGFGGSGKAPGAATHVVRAAAPHAAGRDSRQLLVTGSV